MTVTDPHRTQIEPSSCEARWIVIATPDLNGALRGKALSCLEFQSALRAGATTMTDLVLAVDAVDTPIPTSVGVGPGSGSSDLLLEPDLDTLTELPWQPRWAWCLGSPRWRDGASCDLSPRVVAQRVSEALAELGLMTKAAFEYEFRLYSAETGRPATPGLSYSIVQLQGLAGFLDDLEEAVQACGLSLAAFHTEAGPGLVEASLAPTSGIRAADQAMLLRACVAAIAEQHGLRASFLAKPAIDEEGSGGHLHLSLVGPDGENVFAAPLAAGSDVVNAAMRSAIAGLLDHMGALSVIYNPHVNSYKRLVPGWFAPVEANWGIDDRAAAVRVVTGAAPAATHLELRRAGADANPYLVLAAAGASMLSGLRQSLTLPEPDDAPVAAAPLPSDLRSSLIALKADSIVPGLLGKRFVEHFAATREWELSAFQQVVTTWETTRVEGALARPFLATQ